MAVRGLTDICAHDCQGPATPKGECGYISKTQSMSVLLLCNTFQQVCIALLVTTGKILPYWSYVSEAKKRQDG